MYEYGKPADWRPPALWKHPHRWWGIRHLRFYWLLHRYRRDALQATHDDTTPPYGDLEYAWAVRRGEWYTS